MPTLASPDTFAAHFAAIQSMTHYMRVVAALAETIRLMREVDAAIPIPEWPIDQR